MADVDSLPVAYAYLMGYLPENIKLEVFTSAPLRDSALISHNLIGCISDLLSAVQSADAGAEIRTPITTGGSYALVENDSACQTVAISSGTVIEYMCDTMQVAYDKTIIASMAERCTMLKQQKVKAAVLPEPFAAYAVEKGCRYVKRNADSRVGVMVFYTAYTTTPSFAAFCTAYSRAIAEIAKGADLTASMRFLGFPPVDISQLQLRYTSIAPPDINTFDSVVAYLRSHLQYKGKVAYENLCY